MCSTECDEFNFYTTSAYFDHKRRTKLIAPMEYLRIAELEYRTLYQAKKWTAFKTDPASEFFVGGDLGQNGGTKDENSQGGDDGSYNKQGGSGGNKNRWANITCHNCEKLGHISQNCFLPGGGSHNGGGSRNNTTNTKGITKTYIVHQEEMSHATEL